MFSNRFWILKLLVACAGFASLGQAARRDFGRAFPRLEQAAVVSPDLVGKTVWSSPSRVLSVREEGFDLWTRAGPVRILAARPVPREGDFVSVRGRVVGPRRVEALDVQINEGHGWKRPANYLVSLATLAVFLWLIRARFGCSLREGLFRSRS
ncbi:MAG: hypothetical protein ACK44W_13110 [Planctomycetota bacterium]